MYTLEAQDHPHIARLLRRISETYPGTRVIFGSKATFVLAQSSITKKQIDAIIPEDLREKVLVLHRHER